MKQHVGLIVPFFAALAAFRIQKAEAKIWNAHELAVGEWDVTLRGGWLFDPSKIFPRKSFRKIGDLSFRRRLWGTSMDCSLSLCQDGTFVLSPGKTSSAPELVRGGSTRNIAPRITGRLDMRGNWKVLANPYCITDRFYDQLTLRSYPRAVVRSASWPSPSGTMNLCCRVWGRHNQSDTIGRSGRMTHGTLVWKENKPKRVFPSRRIVASFSARRSSNEPSQGGWEDEVFFGY